MRFTSESFERMLGVVLGDKAREEIDSFALEYEEIPHERELEEIKLLIEEIYSVNLVPASRKREPDWENGWSENLRDFKEHLMPEKLIPRYFGKHSINRLNRKFVSSDDKDFELNMLRSIQAWLFDEYLFDFTSIYEFGCGTGHNLVFLRKFNAFANLIGLDWVESSQTLISLIAEQIGDEKLSGKKFDYFDPDYELVLDKNCAVFTVASLEQIGSEYLPFVNFILANKPDLVVHVEPFEDLLDPFDLIDNLSIQYMRKRQYINGYCEYIKLLASQGKARIHKFQRSFIGSRLIDGYTILIWSPK